MLISLLVLCPLLAPQDDSPVTASPFDRVVELELTSDGSPLDDLGLAWWVDHEVRFSGTLHVWTRSPLDLSLRVESDAGVLLAGDEDSGGGTTPYVRLEVEPGTRLRISVARAAAGSGGAASLHLMAAPETDATGAGLKRGLETLAEVAALLDAGDLGEAGVRIALTLDELEAIEGAHLSDRIAGVLWDLGFSAHRAGDLPSARRAWSGARAYGERTLPEDDPDLRTVRHNLAATMSELGDAASARALFEAVLATYERWLPDDHPDVLGARRSLAITMREMRDLSGARALFEDVLETFEQAVAADHPALLRARQDLAVTIREIGDLPAARAHFEAILAARTRTLPEDHPELLRVRQDLGNTMRDMGDLPGARAHFVAVLEARERSLPEDHPDLLRAMGNLAVTMMDMGDLLGARPLEQAVLAGFERSLPPDHPDLLGARQNVASTMREMGDLVGARTLLDAVLAGFERSLPENHPDLLGARLALASTMMQMGDLAGARALEEAVLATCASRLPADHPEVLRAQQSLAITVGEMGDLQGARLLEEAVLAAREGSLPPKHPDLLSARLNLATTLRAMGDLTGALQLAESVLADRLSALTKDQREVLRARHVLAVTLLSMGDLAGAFALQQEVLAALEQKLPKDHPDLLLARGNLAVMMRERGDLSGARAIQEAVLVASARRLPDDHPDLNAARRHLAVTTWEEGDHPRARELLRELSSGMLLRARSAALLSPREAREVVVADVLGLGIAVSLSDPGDTYSVRRLFELIETRRTVAIDARETAAGVAADAELWPLAQEVAQAHRELNDLVSGTAQEAVPTEDFDERLERLSARRDRGERAIRAALAERGVALEAVTSQALRSALPDDSAAVGFSRYPAWTADPPTGRIAAREYHLLAFVLRPDGTLVRVELGPARELEAAVTRWRAAIGKPIEGDGMPEALASREALDERRAGERLREQLIDPVLEAAGEGTRTLFVCPDDLVFLIPLDALPLGEGRVGDGVQILIESSFARIISPRSPAAGEPALLAIGSPDYDAERTLDEATSMGSSIAVALRGGAAPTRFTPLPQTSAEVASVVALFESAFEADAVVLQGGQATKNALARLAPHVRYLHIATHGWFASETVKSILDSESTRDAQSWIHMDREQRVAGLAPLTLCGLALAGANGGPNSRGRVPGILTAEELLTIDLSRCELAVLSACETNVGLHRAGQGIQSLQAALHAAGVRTAITSLWRVDDAATRALMTAFYDHMWNRELPAAEALWRAKMDLRARRYPVRDWAGWVLSGEPE